MPRNISFFHTQAQIRDRSKTVTRRTGWTFLKPGDILTGIVKGQGLKRGEKVEVLCRIQVVSVHRQPLTCLLPPYVTYGAAEANREGFPQLTGREFVAMFCKNFACLPTAEVTRIEFYYLEQDA